MNKIGIIGGTAFEDFDRFAPTSKHSVTTPFGDPSDALHEGTIEGHPVIFLARHGAKHQIAPHRINYRANIWALHRAGVTHIIGVAAVGGINPKMPTGIITIPDQIIDYTYNREHTFHDTNDDEVTHVDFTNPYSHSLRNVLIEESRRCGAAAVDHATLGVTQGPRLETAAEVDRMERDGCDLVNMTGMPEASLARELKIKYASICLVVNPAAGRADSTITMEYVLSVSSKAKPKIQKLIIDAIKRL